MDIIITIISGLLMLTFLVVAHEWGHYIVGKKCGIKIEEFGVGFGPKLWHKTKGETEYSVRLFPLGGFVQFNGEDEASDDPRAFNNRPIWQRFLTVLAGPMMNIVVALVIAIATLSIFGDSAPYISQVEAGTPAEELGLAAGDRIVNINGNEIDFFMEYSMLDTTAGGESMQISVERNGERIDLDVPYYYDEVNGKDRIGILIGQERVKYGFFEALALAFKWLFVIAKQIIVFLGDLIFHGQGASEVAGPVGTISIIGVVVRTGIENILRITAMISINLGVVNLLPIPALDGGRLVFIIIEKLRGKPIPREKEGYVHFAGLILLFGLMIVLTYSDIMRLIGG